MPIEHFITVVEKAFRDSVFPLLCPGERGTKNYSPEWLVVLAARDNAIAALALMNRPDIDAKVLGTFSALEAYLTRMAIPGMDNLKYECDAKSLAEAFQTQLKMLRPYRLVAANDNGTKPATPTTGTAVANPTMVMAKSQRLHDIADLAGELAADFTNIQQRRPDAERLGRLLQRYWPNWDNDFPYIVAAANTGDLSLLSEPLLRICSQVVRLAAEQAAKNEVNVAAAGVTAAMVKSTAPTASGESTADTEQTKGDWLVPTSLADLGNRLGNVGIKKARTILAPYGLKKAGNRQLWTARADIMPKNIRDKLEGKP